MEGVQYIDAERASALQNESDAVQGRLLDIRRSSLVAHRIAACDMHRVAYTRYSAVIDLDT